MLSYETQLLGMIRIVYGVLDASSKLLCSWHVLNPLDTFSYLGLKAFHRAGGNVPEQGVGQTTCQLCCFSELEFKGRVLLSPSIELKVLDYFQKWSKSFKFQVGIDEQKCFPLNTVESWKGSSATSTFSLSCSGASEEDSKATFQGFPRVCLCVCVCFGVD